MSGFRSPLDAYREDLSRARGRKRLAAGDEFWIILSTGLRRLAQVPSRTRPAAARRLASGLVLLAADSQKDHASKRGRAGAGKSGDTGRAAAVADALVHFPDREFAAALVTQIRGVAADAEEAGAVVLAREMLTDLRELSSHAPALDRGGLLLQLGRISRTLGELDAALDLLRAAGDVGRAERVPELVVREALGAAVVARTRGNYPAARSLFESAAKGASELGLADVSGMAHQGLMIVTAEAGEFDAALRHGWQAWSAARAHGAREAEMLINLAQLCMKTGYDAAALGGFAAALARTSAPRLRLPALAGSTEAAVRLGDIARVEIVAGAIAAEATEAFPFETSRAWHSLARARRALGDEPAADAAAAKAAAIAHAHGFFEITHHIEQEAQPAPASLSIAGLEVIRSLEVWSDDPSAEHRVSNAPTG